MATRERVHEVGLNALGLFAVLSTYADKRGVAWPSLRTLEKVTGASRNSILGYIDALERAGFLVVDRADNASNRYTLAWSDGPPGGAKSEPGVVQNLNQGGSENEPPVVQKMNQGGSEFEPDSTPEKVHQLNSMKTPLAPQGGSEGGSPPAGVSAKRKNKAPGADPDFDRFYAAYPRKVDRERALKAWRKVRAELPPTEELLAILERHKRSRKWTKDGGEYIEYPATWLNNRRWLTQVEEASAQQRPPHLRTNSLTYSPELAAGLYGQANGVGSH